MQDTLNEIRNDGIDDQWYEVTTYATEATARTAAHQLRERHPDMDVTARKGTVLARRKQT